MLKLSSNVSDVFPEVLKLSFEVSECKPLEAGKTAKIHYTCRFRGLTAVSSREAGAYTRPLLNST